MSWLTIRTLSRVLIGGVLAVSAVLGVAIWRAHAAGNGDPHRIRHAIFVDGVLFAVSVLLLVLSRLLARYDRAPTGAGPRIGESWALALLASAIVAQVLLLAVGYLALVPPAIAASHYKAWDFVDKRWIAAAYLSSVGLVYLPGLLKRLLDDATGATDATADLGSGAGVARSSTMRTRVTRAALALAAGSILSVVYVASITPPALTRLLDTHELVQLGGLQAIANGAVPFLEARTQYGPGQQLIIHDLVRNTEMSVRGARLAHLIMNCAAIAILFSTMFFAYGWAIGGGMIFLALFISPLQVTTFVGWGLIVRWLGPFLVGAFVPRALGYTLSPRARFVAFLLLGTACGVLAWISQENGSTSVMTVLLVLSAAVITRRLSVGKAISHAVTFVAGLGGALFGLLLVQFGPSHLREALALYQSGSGLVFAGFTNTAWTDANTHWTEPLSGRGPAFHLIGWRIAGNLSGWRAAYFFTPPLIVGLTALALYPPRKDLTTAGDRNVLALVGMLATAAALDLLTLFRADATHFVGMSLALAPMMVLGIVFLPSRVFAERARQIQSRVVLIAVFLVVYPFLSANTEFRFANMGRAVEGIRIARALWHSAPTNASDTLLPRLGFRAAPGDACCRSNKLTYADLALAMKDVHAAAAGRTVLVDTRDRYSALGPVSSAVYFLGDLRVGTTFVEPMMSIWTDADVVAAEREADRIKPGCLLTGGEDFLLTAHVLRSFGSYSTHKVPGPVTAVLLCRTDPTT